ncbi:MAG: hypothetical protein IT258_01205 [Saprospiraceae bacterium]|nr:hypothetical protein [Saprospiraceae bacterium]
MDVSALCANLYNYENQQLYSVEATPKSDAAFFDGRHFGFDIIEAIFFHISRFEEHFCQTSQLDEHGRMKSNEQFLVKHCLEKTPVVDHLVYCFLVAIGANPVAAPTRFRMSFDIDIMRCFSGRPPIRMTAKYLVSKPSSLPKLWFSYIRTLFAPQNDPYFNFEWLLRKSDKLEQVIYFLVGGSTKFDRPTAKLNNEFKQIVSLAKAMGLRIGLHPSYDCMADDELFHKEKSGLEEILGEKINESRQHFLHFSWKTTPQILEKQGVMEDSSIGFSDRIGFRCGTGFPYQPYSFEREEPWGFMEVPMICMDVALMREAGNNQQRMIEIWDDFLATNKSLTMITFLFHNSRFFDAELEGMDLKYCYEQIFKIKP